MPHDVTEIAEVVVAVVCVRVAVGPGPDMVSIVPLIMTGSMAVRYGLMNEANE